MRLIPCLLFLRKDTIRGLYKVGDVVETKNVAFFEMKHFRWEFIQGLCQHIDTKISLESFLKALFQF